MMLWNQSIIFIAFILIILGVVLWLANFFLGQKDTDQTMDNMEHWSGKSDTEWHEYLKKMKQQKRNN